MTTKCFGIAAGLVFSAMACGSSNAPAGGFAGVYAATWSDTYVVASPAGIPGGTGYGVGTVTITQQSSTQIHASWQIPPNPPSGTIDFAMNGNMGVATGIATGGSCFVGLDGAGDTQTICCTSCSIAFTGNSFIQPNAGTFTGVTSGKVPFSGTYSGEWVGTKP